ncbi:MAG: sigma 54-interacting transcriptional regulator [Candidatus Eremiobacteraeota bacterium]|nr:sigma 54-interacting transcriptional regulator [Candidatus Eremiobacteraeota bacterium]
MSVNATLPPDEPARLAAVRRYQILDTPPDGAFDDLTAVAAALFKVPIAIVSLVDYDRIWFKSHHGLDASETGREPGLCASAIFSPEVYHIRDASTDVRALANPLVAQGFGLRFYAAAPLRTQDGFNLGTLCIIDRKPRDLSPFEAELLAKLAASVMDQMELRLAARKVAELEQAERRISEELRQANEALGESERGWRDLFDEAPIAYVQERLDTRLIQANRAAMSILGIKPEEVAETFGKSLVPETADAQSRLRGVLVSFERGNENSAVLELRRKDNGKPVWLQWWSKPAPSGKYTRTMFVDITERVLLEQEQVRLEAQNAYLWDEIRSVHNLGNLIGGSRAIRHVMQQIQLVAPTAAAVLVTGESGTGKELVARAIHERSPRKGHALITVNCGAIPENLFESEFFGHVRGAFTGALKDKLGRFELADGGTLFLDEISEMPLEMQAKLLRVLQERELERVGDTRSRKIDVRIVAATNRDLKQEVDAGHFRQDLYYRLSVFPIELPPLRERCDDIVPLAAHFVTQTALRMNRPGPRLTQTAMDQLTSYAWPGNVRELQNAIERAVILAQGGALEFDWLKGGANPPTAAAAPAAPPAVLTNAELKERERQNMMAALAQTGGKIFGSTGAAALLGMKPTTVISRLKSLGLECNKPSGKRE